MKHKSDILYQTDNITSDDDNEALSFMDATDVLTLFPFHENSSYSSMGCINHVVNLYDIYAFISNVFL